MAVNFGLLQPAQPVSAFFQGQQDVQREADQNMLRQQQAEQMQFQRENMAAQRAERLAMAADRQAMTQERAAKAAQAAQRQQFLAGLGAKMAEGGYKLDRPTLGQVLQFGMQTGEDSLIKLATEGMRALDEEAREAAEMSRIRGPAPSMMRQPAAALPAAPAAPTNMLAGTPFDIGVSAPAPANALAVRPAAEPMVGGFTRAEINEMAGSDVKAVRERGERLAKLLPKDQVPKLSDRLVPVGKLVFDRETRQFITPPAAAIAATQDRGAAAPAPAKEPAAKPLTAAQEATRRDKLGKEFKSASSALQTTQDVLDSIAAVKDSPGLSRATGFTGTMLPSFPEGQAAQAETRLANLKGKITALGKAQAAATGAIGSIANQEWKILSDQIAAIDPVKGAGPLLEQIGLVEAQALGAMERMRDEYSRQFGEDFERFPQFRDLPPPKSTQPKGRKSGGAVTPAGAAPAPATGALSPAEQAELEQLRNRFRKGG
jgi:hypothetical protein